MADYDDDDDDGLVWFGLVQTWSSLSLSLMYLVTAFTNWERQR